MKKQDVWDESINPDGISNEITDLNLDVWDRGYHFYTDDGIWYEVYVNDTTKKYYPKIDIISNSEDKEVFGSFDSIILDHYEEYNQITFFVPNEEKNFTLDELTNILI